MKFKFYLILILQASGFLGGICLLGACGQLPDYRSLENIDLQPPRIEKIIPSGPKALEILFSEPLLELPALTFSPDPYVENRELEEDILRLTFSTAQDTGRKYTISGKVNDRSGNSLTFQYHFYGYNPRPPSLLINEFTTQGSGKHPDIVELRVTEGGNLGGLVLCEGSTDNHDDRLILPPVEAEAGEYILIHFKPQGIPEEVNETEDRDASGGYDARPDCLDFWVGGGDGLSGNNGTLCLYAFPEGPLIDGLLYSNRTSASDTDYRGFGSKKVMERADQLYSEGGWYISGEKIAPEDGINPDDSTATRSVCRDPESENSRSSADWHIVPTGGYTFGGVNSTERYLPAD